MCIKAGDTELESVKALMSMSLKAIVSESLDADIDDIHEKSTLVGDLKMDPKGKATLQNLIAEYFNGLTLDIPNNGTYGCLLKKVVLSEFDGLLDDDTGIECDLAA